MAAAKKPKKPRRRKTAAKPAPEPESAEVVLPGGETIDRTERDSLIFRAWLSGITTQTLAHTYDLDPSAISRIVAKARDEGSRAMNLKPMVAIEEHLLKIDWAIGELAQIGGSSKNNAGVRVSAISRKITAYKERLEMLQTVGLLPHDLGTMSVHINGLRAAEQIIEILERHDVGEDALLEIENMWADHADPAIDGDGTEIFEDAPQLPAPVE